MTTVSGLLRHWKIGTNAEYSQLSGERDPDDLRLKTNVISLSVRVPSPELLTTSENGQEPVSTV